MSSRSPTAGLARAALALALVLALAAAAAAHAGAHAAGARGELDLEVEEEALGGTRHLLLGGRGIGLGIRQGIRALEDVLPELFSSLGR